MFCLRFNLKNAFISTFTVLPFSSVQALYLEIRKSRLAKKRSEILLRFGSQ